MKAKNRQSGVVLLVSLVLLLLLTTIAITAANTSSLQMRMAANSQQHSIAFQAAESGIRQWLDKFTKSPKILAMETSGNLFEGQTTEKPVKYAAAAEPNHCVGVIPAFSQNASDDNTSFRYACFNIQSTGTSCPDADCNSHLAQTQHIQGHLVRY